MQDYREGRMTKGCNCRSGGRGNMGDLYGILKILFIKTTFLSNIKFKMNKKRYVFL